MTDYFLRCLIRRNFKYDNRWRLLYCPQLARTVTTARGYNRTRKGEKMK